MVVDTAHHMEVEQSVLALEVEDCTCSSLVAVEDMKHMVVAGPKELGRNSPEEVVVALPCRAVKDSHPKQDLWEDMMAPVVPPADQE